MGAAIEDEVARGVPDEDTACEGAGCGHGAIIGESASAEIACRTMPVCVTARTTSLMLGSFVLSIAAMVGLWLLLAKLRSVLVQRRAIADL